MSKTECPYCGKKLKGLKRHIKRMHKRESSPPAFANAKPCDNCGSSPTRVFYGPTREEDLFLCEGCAESKYCRECQRVFGSERGLRVHVGRIHREISTAESSEANVSEVPQG